MCVKEGRPNVMLKENSERKIAAPGGTRTHNLLLSWHSWLHFIHSSDIHHYNRLNYTQLCEHMHCKAIVNSTHMHYCIQDNFTMHSACCVLVDPYGGLESEQLAIA